MFRDFNDEMPNEPEYHGFKVYLFNQDHLHYAIEPLDGSPLPNALQGLWTSADHAKQAIRNHLNLDPSTKVYE